MLANALAFRYVFEHGPGVGEVERLGLRHRGGDVVPAELEVAERRCGVHESEVDVHGEHPAGGPDLF